MRVQRLMLGALMLCSSLTVLAPPIRVAAQAPAPTGVSWQSAGDSYSSGEGVLGNEGDCAQSQAAYGPTAADLLRTRGWQISGETFTACTGHLVEDYFNARSGSSQSLWDWGREQSGPERVDVITMSFGGNDIGFADVLVGCVVGLPDSWGSFLNKPACDAEEELNARIDSLLDPPRRNCNGLRSDGGGAFDCDLDLGDRRGSIIDFYYDVVTQRLTDRGRLVIVGYPRIFADVNQWPSWVKVSCEGVKRGDTEKLGRLAEHLNNRLREAVRRANEALGSERVLFVDRFATYRDGLHELCGTNEDWLNGLLFSRGQGFEFHQESSFHPNYEGHEAIAPLVADRLDIAFPRGSTSSTTAQGAIMSLDMMNARLPAGSCNSPDGESWWSDKPIQLVDGSGNSDPYDPARGYSGVGVMSTAVVGYADLDRDGTTDVLLAVDCAGSPVETCCAGRASLVTVALPVRLAGSDLELIGRPIWGEAIGDAESQITGVTLVGTSIHTTESVIYPETDGYFADEQRSYVFDGQEWVRR